MSQKIFTKNFGELDVVRSWQDGPYHVAKLTNGSYAHITGLPVTSKDELRAVLVGQEYRDAEEWFDNRHKAATEDTPLRIMDDNGSFIFEDGSAIETVSQIIQSVKPGAFLEVVLAWFTAKRQKDAMDQRKEDLALKTAATTEKPKPLSKPTVDARAKAKARKAIQAKKASQKPKALPEVKV